MATLVFDIETTARSWDSFDVQTQVYLTKKYCKHGEEMDMRELGLSPFTGEIVSIGLYDVERAQGVVYVVGEDVDGVEDGAFVYRARSEKEMLEDFWDGALHYDTFVTYNGRAFDVPFITMRSAICGVRPSLDLRAKRYLAQQTMPFHVDLFDQFTTYGTQQRWPSLRLACQAFGVVVEWVDGGGGDVAELFRMKKFRDIARHNACDVHATAELYHRWLTHLAPHSFVNRLENM